MTNSAKHLDEYEEALGRSDKAISSLTHDLDELNNSIGQEIGVKHQYSKKIHVGTVDKVTSDTLTLTTQNKKKIFYLLLRKHR